MTPMAEVRGRPRVWRLSALAAGQRSRQTPDFDVGPLACLSRSRRRQVLG